MPDYFLVSCEHGGNRIPAAYRHFFRGHEALLPTHRGYDAGALVMARELAAQLPAPLVVSTTSRLLIDLNRSIGHPTLYSEATRNAPPAVRRDIVQHYYLPYRTEAEDGVEKAIENGERVIHISSHSFTPELNGEVRNADVGLLYDPVRPGEVDLCRHWQAAIREFAPILKVRRNYPYAGKADGLTAHLRRRFPPDEYIGIELEVNQKHVIKSGRQWRILRTSLIAALCKALARRAPHARGPRWP